MAIVRSYASTNADIRTRLNRGSTVNILSSKMCIRDSSDTGLHKLLTGSFHSLLQQLPELFLVLLDLFHNKDFRISGKRAYLHILFQMELFRHLIQLLQILRGQRLVIPQSRVRLGQILIGDKYVHLAPLYIRLQKAADG